jgi:hypothetical protein
MADDAAAVPAAADAAAVDIAAVKVDTAMEDEDDLPLDVLVQRSGGA